MFSVMFRNVVYVTGQFPVPEVFEATRPLRLQHRLLTFSLQMCAFPLHALLDNETQHARPPTLDLNVFLVTGKRYRDECQKTFRYTLSWSPIYSGMPAVLCVS